MAGCMKVSTARNKATVVIKPYILTETVMCLHTIQNDCNCSSPPPGSNQMKFVDMTRAKHSQERVTKVTNDKTFENIVLGCCKIMVTAKTAKLA